MTYLARIKLIIKIQPKYKNKSFSGFPPDDGSEVMDVEKWLIICNDNQPPPQKYKMMKNHFLLKPTNSLFYPSLSAFSSSISPSCLQRHRVTIPATRREICQHFYSWRLVEPTHTLQPGGALVLVWNHQAFVESNTWETNRGGPALYVCHCWCLKTFNIQCTLNSHKLCQLCVLFVLWEEAQLQLWHISILWWITVAHVALKDKCLNVIQQLFESRDNEKTKILTPSVLKNMYIHINT